MTWLTGILTAWDYINNWLTGILTVWDCINDLVNRYFDCMGLY